MPDLSTNGKTKGSLVRPTRETREYDLAAPVLGLMAEGASRQRRGRRGMRLGGRCNLMTLPLRANVDEAARMVRRRPSGLGTLTDLNPEGWKTMKRTVLAAVLLGALAACSNSTPPAGSSVATSPIASAESPAASTPGADAVTVTGVEYAYQGVPDSPKTGTVVTFVNGGNEVHEVVAVRRNEGVSTSLDELLAMPEEESNQLVSFLGVAIASPGETAPDTITLDQPGSYIFICFIPVGTTELPSLAPDATPNESLLPEGPPHFVQGMVAEFNVTE